MDQYLIAHDLGTSGDKATLFTTDGRLIRSAVVSYEARYFGQSCAEEDPEDWWRAVCSSTREIMEGIHPADVIGLSFSAQMQGCLLVDREGNPLRPSIIWADQRSVKEKDRLINELGFDTIYEITGHRPNQSYTIEKIMWLKEHEPETYRKAYRSLQAKDYILFKMTGKFVTDYSDASGTNAFDLDGLVWSDDIVRASGINPELLPELHASTDIIGGLTAEAAVATGLCEGMPVVCGGGDGPCSAAGAGCINDDELFTSFGTSAWIGGTTKKKFLDPDHVLMCFGHVIPGRYMPCGTMQAAGSSYSYMRRLFAPDSPYSELNKLIESARPGSRGLIFLPYMIGERCPRWNEKTSGAFIGMRMQHGKPEYLRATIEGIAYNLEIILQAYRKRLNVSDMIMTGGGAKGDIVCQIMADVFHCNIRTPDNVESATSIAAAVIAGVGIGAYRDFSEISRFLTIDRHFSPTPGIDAVYDPLRRIFDECYHALVPAFSELDSYHNED